jgi:osmotically-inducible protein OsmY
LAITLACTNSANAPDVTDNIRHALDSAGLTDVNGKQDRDKNVVSLAGNVATADDKGRAESIARSQAGSAVAADQIGVRPKGDESTAKNPATTATIHSERRICPPLWPCVACQ